MNTYYFNLVDRDNHYVMIEAKDDLDTVTYEINNYIEDHKGEDYSIRDLLDTICEVDWKWKEIELNDIYLTERN